MYRGLEKFCTRICPQTKCVKKNVVKSKWILVLIHCLNLNFKVFIFGKCEKNIIMYSQVIFELDKPQSSRARVAISNIKAAISYLKIKD